MCLRGAQLVLVSILYNDIARRMGTPADPPSSPRSPAVPVTKVDYKNSAELPRWVVEVIETGLAIEQEDARAAGKLGFMTRAIVSATLPYKDPKSRVFERRNGDLTMTILAPKGVPFGKYPRLLLSYLITEAVTTRSNVIKLGDTLADFLRETVGVASTGGKQGTQTRLSEQMQRLFTAMVTVDQVKPSTPGGGVFEFENITIVERGRLEKSDLQRFDSLAGDSMDEAAKLWLPLDEKDGAGRWNSIVELTPRFFQECIETPVPIDMRAYKVLSTAPMAMDIYAWLTYRMSYMRRPSAPIPWPVLQAQFGSDLPFTEQGARDFKKAFKRNLDLVRQVYRGLRVDETTNSSGLILMPSPTHIPKSLPRDAGSTTSASARGRGASKKSDQGDLF